MTIGSAMQSAVTAAINSIGSSIVITEYTDESPDGGYTGVEETTVSTQDETAIPYEEFEKVTTEKIGKLNAGGTQIALKSTVTLSSSASYKITWQGEIYDLDKIKRYTIQDTLVAYIVTVSLRNQQ